ncbi:hypothetical protein [Paraburkholderia phytofirmans]|uniref:hypothetical protein n=1 Tax=Paraburkholderia phytofirmans TaxID=261302 RepID=UPI0038BCD319
MIQILFADGSAGSRRMNCRSGVVGNAAAAALTIKPLRQQKNQSFCICKARRGRKTASDSDAPHDINRRSTEERINSGLHICRRWLVLSLKYWCFSAYSRQFIDINIEFDCLFDRFVLLIFCRRLEDVHRSLTSPTLPQHRFK